MVNTFFSIFPPPEVKNRPKIVAMNTILRMVRILPGGEIKRDLEIGKTAIQPEPAQTADLSISGSHLISSLCIYFARI